MTSAQLYTLAPMIQGDWRDAYLMALFTLQRERLTPYARMMQRAGLAGFNRSYPLEERRT